MQTKMVYELNKSYMVMLGDEIDKSENYKYKMLTANQIKNLMPIEMRLINNEKKIYVDVSGKESMLNYFNIKTATRSEIKKLFEAIYCVLTEIKKYLIRETDVVMRPEMIYKNLSTGSYEFICVPIEEKIQSINEGMNTLLKFLMMHLDNTDLKLVNTIYAINDMYEVSMPDFSLVYEFFMSEIKEEEETDIEENNIDETYEKKNHYIPSVKEVVAILLCTAGLLLTGYNIYLSML